MFLVIGRQQIVFIASRDLRHLCPKRDNCALSIFLQKKSHLNFSLTIAQLSSFWLVFNNALLVCKNE